MSTEPLSSERPAADLQSIGWWIESADDEIYGPASRATLVRFLSEGVISPNTLVRHSTEFNKRPAMDVPGVREALPASTSYLPHGDRLGEAWPRRKRDQLALAQDSLPCVWKNRPAVLVCLRCGAPYCDKYRGRPFKKQFYFCRRCQGRLYNRRSLAWLLDAFLLYLVFLVAPLAVIGGLRAAQVVDFNESVFAGVYYGMTALFWITFALRDPLLGQAGLGKRIFGLKVVKTSDGETPQGFGQALVRWLPIWIPIFVLVDFSVPFRDPLMRRYGDRWAGTRVIDTDSWLSQVRRRVVERLFQKRGIRLLNPIQTPMSSFARTVE
jgi:uncharacterized RDD family membrane protein YckC